MSETLKSQVCLCPSQRVLRVGIDGTLNSGGRLSNLRTSSYFFCDRSKCLEEFAICRVVGAQGPLGLDQDLDSGDWNFNTVQFQHLGLPLLPPRCDLAVPHRSSQVRNRQVSIRAEESLS